MNAVQLSGLLLMLLGLRMGLSHVMEVRRREHAEQRGGDAR